MPITLAPLGDQATHSGALEGTQPVQHSQLVALIREVAMSVSSDRVSPGDLTAR